MTGWVRRAGAALGATVVVLGGVGLGGSAHAGPKPAALQPAGVQPAASSSPAGVSLVGQSTTVSSGHAFSLRLSVPAAVRATDSISVNVYPVLVARSYFDEAAQGHVPGAPASNIYTSGQIPLRDAPGKGTSVNLNLPVNRASKGKDLPEFYLGATGAGVYPLQVQLNSPGGPVGTPLTTFFVFSPPTTGTHKLAFSLSLPVNAAPQVSKNATASLPSAAASSELARLSRTLASFPSVPVSLDVTPQTVAALATGSKADRDTVRTLAGVVSHGDELLPSPYVRTSLPALGNVGLDSQIYDQLDTGSATLKRLLGQAPDPGTWVFDSPIDEPTLQLLAARGLRRLILPDGDLSPLPSDLSATTYGHPATVPDGLRGGRGPSVVGADPILSGRLTQSGNQVLAAEQLLAELAMIQTESPASARGVAVIVPRGQSVSGQLLTTLLAGLRHDPLVRAVTAGNLFASASPTRGGAPASSSSPSSSSPSSPASPVRRLRGRVPESFPDQLEIASTLSRLASVRTVVPTQTGLFAGVTEQVLLAGSDQISQADRARLLQTANQHLQSVSRQIRVVGATSVTLTSRNARLPFTIDSLSKVPVHVDLLLDSTKLTFKPFKPPDGTCSVRAQTLEECSLVLTASQTAFHLPVQARTTGVFPLDMSLQSPDAALVLTTARVTVRSTAVSFVGWALIVGAGLLLVIWWGRDIHRGRRARQLVDRPEDVADASLEAGSSPDGVLGVGGKEAGVVRPVLRRSVLRHSAIRSATRSAVAADLVGWRVSPSQAAMGPIVGSGPGRHPEERP